MKLFLVISKAHFVGLPHVIAYSITIPWAGFVTLLALVQVDNMAGAIWEATQAVNFPPMFLEDITFANKRKLTLFFLWAVVLTVVVPRIPCGPLTTLGFLSSRGASGFFACIILKAVLHFIALINFLFHNLFLG